MLRLAEGAHRNPLAIPQNLVQPQSHTPNAEAEPLSAQEERQQVDPVGHVVDCDADDDPGEEANQPTDEPDGDLAPVTSRDRSLDLKASPADFAFDFGSSELRRSDLQRVQYGANCALNFSVDVASELAPLAELFDRARVVCAPLAVQALRRGFYDRHQLGRPRRPQIDTLFGERVLRNESKLTRLTRGSRVGGHRDLPTGGQQRMRAAGQLVT